MTTIPSKPTAGDKAIAKRMNKAITDNYKVYRDIKRCANILLMFINMHPSRTEMLINQYKDTISKL